MLPQCFLLFTIYLQLVFCYSNKQFTIVRQVTSNEFKCIGPPIKTFKTHISKIKNLEDWEPRTFNLQNYNFPTIKTTVSKAKDPLIEFQTIIEQVLYGRKQEQHESASRPILENNVTKQNFIKEDVDVLAHSPTGQVMRAATFYNKRGVYLPFTEYIHRNHAYLNVTRDHMQTAVDAFAIFLAGSVDDIMRLPPAYVLDSARTIAMMRIAQEKLAATWLVVKGSMPTEKISYQTLEKFRPLFKYINGKEIARLNLMDDKILSYIGTHPDLTRHQVGVVANRYLQLNQNWTEAKYLNLMNNLLCGVPMIIMRQIPKNTYLQLTHQLFHHIRACDTLQRKFYLQMMTRTQAVGRPYSWSARDVSRLGLLFTEVDGPSLSAINPEAMAGITSKVMLEMRTKTLKCVTELQMRYMEPKARNIMARKLLAHEKLTYNNNGLKIFICTLWPLILCYNLKTNHRI